LCGTRVGCAERRERIFYFFPDAAFGAAALADRIF
jgi:hypothetical protein